MAEPILPMNTSTVYRTLNTLTEKEILIRSVRQDGKAYYALAKKDHSHRLVCDLCGKVIPVDTCPLSELEETLQGLPLDEHLEDNLQKIHIDEYMKGIRVEELAALLRD